MNFSSSVISFVKFALGGCLARLTLAGAWSGPLRYAATPAAAGVCALFFATDPDAVFFREAAVLPLFCLLIVGLAEGRDPLARVLQLRVLAWWGRLSYPVYILHTAVAITIKQLTSEPDYSTTARRRGGGARRQRAAAARRGRSCGRCRCESTLNLGLERTIFTVRSVSAASRTPWTAC